MRSWRLELENVPNGGELDLIVEVSFRTSFPQPRLEFIAYRNILLDLAPI